MSAGRHGPTKTASLYLWIVGLTAALDAGMVYAVWPTLSGAYHRNPLLGVLVGTCVAFISYFWLNGVKDIIYTACYHLVVKRRWRPVPHRMSLWAPRVVLVYCTCDDFAAWPLLRSMDQGYSNYETVILDDSRTPEFRRLVDDFASAHGVRVIRRRGGNGFKAGNLNHGLGLLKFDYFVILDSDEVIPHNFIARSLDYFAERPDVGIVQGNHRATRNRNRFMARFSIGVDSHWWAYQSVKDRYGFMSLLGHGAMVSKVCFAAVGGFPMLVAEDICLSIEARNLGWLTVFAPDLMCEEEYPPDFLAFKKRHNKWTQGNMEFIKTYTGAIFRSRMPWYEKLDIVLFTYSLPLTAVFSVYVLINVIAFPAMHYTLHYPLWMLAPTVLFLLAPMLNDVLFHARELTKRQLATYLGQSILLYGAMFFVSLRSSVKSAFGSSTFLITPKGDTRLTMRQAVSANRWELVFGAGLSTVVILLTGSILGIGLLTVPALFSVYMSVLHQPTKRESARAERDSIDAPTEVLELVDA